MGGLSGEAGRKPGSRGVVESLRRDMEEIVEEYRAVWLARNRPGGLEDSVRRMERILEDYQ
jgi:hypothetical protein